MWICRPARVPIVSFDIKWKIAAAIMHLSELSCSLCWLLYSLINDTGRDVAIKRAIAIVAVHTGRIEMDQLRRGAKRLRGSLRMSARHAHALWSPALARVYRNIDHPRRIRGRCRHARCYAIVEETDCERVCRRVVSTTVDIVILLMVRCSCSNFSSMHRTAPSSRSASDVASLVGNSRR